jgi:hypothetical protein
MAEEVRRLEELKGRGLDVVLHEVARLGKEMTVVLEDGDMVVIRPVAPLKPLPALEGYLPEGWKDAIR